MQMRDGEHRRQAENATGNTALETLNGLSLE